MSRTPARKKPVKRGIDRGNYFGYGPQFEDAVSGWVFPVRTHAMKQRGRQISRRYQDGSRDQSDGPLDVHGPHLGPG